MVLLFSLLTGSGQRQRRGASCRAEWEDRDEGSNEFVSLVMKCVTLTVTAYFTSEYQHCLAVFQRFSATNEFIYCHRGRERTSFDLNNSMRANQSSLLLLQIRLCTGNISVSVQEAVEEIHSNETFYSSKTLRLIQSPDFIYTILYNQCENTCLEMFFNSLRTLSAYIQQIYI